MKSLLNISITYIKNTTSEFDTLDTVTFLPKQQLYYGQLSLLKNISFYNIYKKKDHKLVHVGIAEFLSDKLVNYTTKSGKLIEKFVKPLFFTHDPCDDQKDVVEAANNDEVEDEEDPKQFELADMNDVFVTTKGAVLPPPLKEETKDEASTIRAQFKKSHVWIQNYFTNNQYAVIENEGGGDCLFACLRDAYSSVGMQTTVTKLRRAISDEMTNALFSEYYSKYEFYNHENNLLGSKIKELETKYQATNDMFVKTTDLEAKKKLHDICQTIASHRENIINKKKLVVEILSLYTFMKNVDTIEKLQKKMQTSFFWANEWTISAAERIFKIKLILLDSVMFESKELYNVLVKSKSAAPPGQIEYYLIAEKNHDVYKLVGYKEKQIFKFVELPYDLKKLICCQISENRVESSSDWKDIATFAKTERLYINEKRKKAQKDREAFSDSTLQNLYDDTFATFEISSFASSKVLPGMATRETIKEETLIDFYKLHSFEKWRQKLHDNWIAPFSIDEHNWNSVTHYLIANKFGSENKFYLFFTAESNTPLSKDVSLAIAAGSVSGKLKNKLIRPADIKIINPKISKKKYKKVLLAKFEQNLDLKQILMSTKNAKLVYYKKGRHPVIADDLMVVRHIFKESKEDC